MLNRYIFTGALAAACSSGLVAAQAQQPQTPSPTTPSTTTSTQRPASETAAQQAATTTVVGCIYRERDVPGRAPNVAERAGISEDYILAEVSGLASTGTTGAPGATGADSSSSSSAKATGTAGSTGPMYKLEFVDDDKLQALIGKRVEVTGKIDKEAGDSAAPAPGTRSSTTEKVIGRDQVAFSEFEVSAIKEVSGTCPAMPSTAK